MGKEHRIFKKLLEILEENLGAEGGAAVKAGLKNTLEVLLPAFEAHEEIEESILGTTTYASERKAREALESASRSHTDLLSECAGTARRRPRPCAVPRTREHFEFEEKRLWPYFRLSWRKVDFPRHVFLEAAIRQRVKTVEKDILRLRRGEIYV